MSSRRRLSWVPLAALAWLAWLPAGAGAEQHYPIEETWALASLLEASPVPVDPDADALGCEARAAADAGVLPIAGDLSFQTRAGPLATRCRFHTRSLWLRPGWRLAVVVWREIRLQSELDLCRLRDLSVDSDTDTRVAARRFEMACAPSLGRDASEAHGARAVLERIELIGPTGGHWRDAFDVPGGMGPPAVSAPHGRSQGQRPRRR